MHRHAEVLGFHVTGGALAAAAVFRELYSRVINPLRPLMLWDAEVRGADALFASFRRHMMQLVQEVRPTPCAGPMAAGPLQGLCGWPQSNVCMRKPKKCHRVSSPQEGRGNGYAWRSIMQRAGRPEDAAV